MSFYKRPLSDTLQIQRPFGRTFLLGLAILAGLLLLLEGLARTPLADALLLAPGIGTNVEQVNVKLHQFEQVAAEEDLNCILIGSSMVMYSIDPATLNQSYRTQTGEELQCFNLGFPAMTTVSALPWIDYLKQTYQPEVIIWGVSARDLNTGAGEEALAWVLDTPWLQYQLGNPGPEGWWLDHSMAYRYFDTYRYWNTPAYPDRLEGEREFAAMMGRYGYRPLTTSDPKVADIPTPESELFLADELEDYHIAGSRVEKLDQIVALQDDTLRLILVEMPLPETYMYLFPNGADDYAGYIDFMTGYAPAHDLTFIRSMPEMTFPLDHWYDYNHVNDKGAQIFSRWLGEQLAALEGWR